MKLFSPIPVLACALFLAAGGIGGATSSALAQAAAQDSSAAATVAGDWQMSFTDKSGDPRQGTLQLKQSGSELSGTYQGPRGTFPLTGSLQGNQVAVTVKAPRRTVSFSGTVDGGKMSGTTEQGKSWTATRQ